MENKRNQGKTAGIGDAAVAKATGRPWSEWLKVLDKAGARKMGHKDIAAHLRRQEKLSPWWSQMVTVGYEQARGMRLPGEKAGGFDISRSKTLAVSAPRAFAAWKDAARRRAWLKNSPATLRTAKANRSIRLSWSGDTVVSVNFHRRSRARCQVVVDHTKLPDAGSAERMKAFWAGALVRLGEYLERPAA